MPIDAAHSLTTAARGREATTVVMVRCRVCTLPFTYTELEKRRLHLRGLHPPRRCPECRAVARRERGVTLTP